jgi:hypothetical protein
VMMVNCPKCGFSQPDDQYCANCGVDMVMYRAKRSPSGFRFLSNTKFHLSVLAAVAVVGGFYVRSVNKSTVDRTISDTPVARDVDQQESALAEAQADVADSRKQMNETNAASVSSLNDLGQGSTPQAASDQGSAQGLVAQAPAPSAGGAPASTATTSVAAGIRAAVQPAQNLRVTYIEAQTAFLQDLLNESQQGSGDGTVSWGVFQNLDQRLTGSRNWHSLGTPSTKPIAINKRNLFFSTMPDQTAGLTVQVIPLARDEAGTRLQVDANRTLRDPAATAADSYNFRMPENFTLPKGSALIVTGVLPHRPLSDGETQLYRNLNVLKSMTGDPFRSGATDIAIIVEAR